MIRITIEAERGEGKTLCAYALERALTQLGAVVTIKENDGTPQNSRAHQQYVSELRLAALHSNEQLLAGKRVQVDTELPATQRPDYGYGN